MDPLVFSGRLTLCVGWVALLLVESSLESADATEAGLTTEAVAEPESALAESEWAATEAVRTPASTHSVPGSAKAVHAPASTHSVPASAKAVHAPASTHSVPGSAKAVHAPASAEAAAPAASHGTERGGLALKELALSNKENSSTNTEPTPLWVGEETNAIFAGLCKNLQ